MTEIARRETAAPSLPEKMDWVRTMATANLLPSQYRNNPGNLFFAVEYADALGVDRMAAITSIHVIEGKPSASADLIANLIRKAGHRLRVSGDDTHAIAQIIRADDPDFTYEARWDMDKARAAGLAGKGVWRNYPGAMLRSRAITEVARMGASDALFGVIYTPEELGAELDDRGEVVHSVTAVQEQPPAPSSGADRMRQIVGATQTTGAEGSPAETPVAGGEAGSSPAGHPSAPVGITEAQVKKMATAMGKIGLTDRGTALAYVASVIGREVASRNDLTKDEASRVIDALEADEITTDHQPLGEPVDAELVPEADGSADEVWERIRAFDTARGMSEADSEDAYSTHAGGLLSSEASAAELQAYLEHLQAQAGQAVHA